MNTPFNTEQDQVPAIIVSTDDPECRGRVKCQRLDQAHIPVDQLPWTFIHNQDHSAQVWGKDGKSIGSSTHTLIPGTWIMANRQKFADGQTQSGGGSIPTDGTGKVS